jgi:L-threonylcarbamoyladenylate synthase
MDENIIEKAARTLRDGGLLGLPTETVYGLAADAENELAVRKIFAAKGRPQSHPLIVHLANAEAAPAWTAQFPPAAQKLAERFWPGPLTLVLTRSPKALDVVTGGQQTVALRIPRHPMARAILEKFGGGVAAPSANRFGKVSPTRAEHVLADLGAAVDFVADGGPCDVGLESTIVDLSAGPPALLRPGGLSVELIEEALGQKLPLRKEGIRAPGMMRSHYAPRAGVVLAPPQAAEQQSRALAAQGRKVALLSSKPPLTPGPLGHFALSDDPAAAARSLYATLRAIDEQGYDVIVVALPPRQGLGLALLDRLARAAQR